jgi:hypothetical protein
LSNGRGITRIELGFSIDHEFMKVPGQAVLKAVDDVLSLDVRIDFQGAGTREGKLGTSAANLAKHYLAATTRTKPMDGFQPSAWWVDAGEPLVFVELLDAPIEPRPRTFRTVELPWAGYRLYYTRALYRGQYIGVWILNAVSGLPVYRRAGDYDETVTRSVRLHLMRLHAERQTLKSVFQHIDDGRLPVQARREEGDPLQIFLNRASEFLLSKEFNGKAMSPALNAIEAFDDLVAPGQRASLLEQLNDIRPNILKKVRNCTDRAENYGGGVNLLGNNGPIALQIQMNREEGKLVSQFVDAKGAIIHGDFVVADLINGSFNRVKDSQVNNDLKTNLDALNKAVAAMAQELPADGAKDAAKALDTVTREATSEKPDEDYFATGSNKLLKIAKAVGEAAGPVVSVIGAVAKLLGFAGIGVG